MNSVEDLRFPIGDFIKPDRISADERNRYIETISAFPAKLKDITAGLEEKLSWRYRPEGWSIQQVVHHCADSHMNALIRFKLTLTEDQPTIRPYFEDRWARLDDTVNSSIEESLFIIRGVHSRWTTLIRSMSQDEFSRIYIHPEHGQEFSLDQALANYHWHCNHHYAHVLQALEHEGKWN